MFLNDAENKRRDSWRKFTYNLLYPAILGSMLYDCLIFDEPFIWAYVAELFLVFLYVIHYFHLYFDLKVEKETNGLWYLANILIPIFFGLAYVFISSQDYVKAFPFLVVIAFLMFIYPSPNVYVKRLYLTSKLGFLLLTVVGLVYSWIQHFTSGEYVMTFMILFTLYYLLQTLRWLNLIRANQPTASQMEKG